MFRPVNTTPVPQRKKQTLEERPSRIGTRVSPRTLQRQTGLTLYKDTSSESEEESEVENIAVTSDGDENDAQISDKENQSSTPEAAAAVKKTPARPKRRTRGGGGSRRRSRKKIYRPRKRS